MLRPGRMAGSRDALPNSAACQPSRASRPCRRCRRVRRRSRSRHRAYRLSVADDIARPASHRSRPAVGYAAVPPSTFRFVKVPEPGAEPFSKTLEDMARCRRRDRVIARVRDPGVTGIGRVNDRSTLGKRVGEVELSIRCHVTVEGSEASALWVTKIRPADVAAQSVPWSALVARRATTSSRRSGRSQRLCSSGHRPWAGNRRKSASLRR